MMEGGSGEPQELLPDEDTDSVKQQLEQMQKEALLPLKEDLSEWLSDTIGVNINVSNFMDKLDDGILMCKLANVIQSKAEAAVKNGNVKQTLKSKTVKCRDNAVKGSFFARDNAANFLQWCRHFGVHEECLFESEGLVSHRDEKLVILCLLELARMGQHYGLKCPSIIKLEQEIDQTNGAASSRSSSGQSSRGPGRKQGILDQQVEQVVNTCQCKPKIQFKRLAEGKYNIGGRNMFIRLLKGKHLMVRVGGGWDTLDHYLLTHDPCKILEYRRSGKAGQASEGDGDKFLGVRGKYKSAN